MTHTVIFTSRDQRVAEMILAKVQAMREFQAKPIPNVISLQLSEGTYRVIAERFYRVDASTPKFSEAGWEEQLLTFLVAWAKGYADAYQDFVD